MDDDFTVGVEEEYLTVDAASLELRPWGDRVLAAARPALGPGVQAELNLAQIEIATPVCRSSAEIDTEIRRARAALGRAAASRQAAVAATGTHPDGCWLQQAITPVDRYLDIARDYQQLAREQVICGCHVHVGIGDPDRAVRVMDRLRSWVPVLLALSANSPYWQGTDTGYASYRTEVFDRWPTAGPPPVCGDREGYERVVGELVALGMIPDPTYVYWHLRPSCRYPTLELRVADVAMTVDEAVTLAGLFRALVRTVSRRLDHERYAFPRHELVRAATWRACRYGLEGPLIDLVRGEEASAHELVHRLLDYIRADCEEDGEWTELSGRVGAILIAGNGAQRQRAVLRATGSLASVTRMIVERTIAGTTAAPAPAGRDLDPGLPAGGLRASPASRHRRHSRRRAA
jgi:glutamate---cysteine ligase / carboxylate-amine ligase